MSTNRFDWYYQENTVFDKHNKNLCVTRAPYKETPYFQHVFCKDEHVSERFELIRPMFYFFEYRTGYTIKNVVRCMANCMLPQNENYLGIPHVDAYSDKSENIKLKTMLYYVNGADGDTVLFKERYETGNSTLTVDTKCQPKMGKALIFDSNTYHCASSPTTNRRMVINLIFEIE